MKEKALIMKKVSLNLPTRQADAMEAKVSAMEYPCLNEVYRTAIREFLEHHPNTQVKSSEAAACPAA
jgi:Arc/MetJ-type ribon-helix-helix transcriptional regulator